MSRVEVPPLPALVVGQVSHTRRVPMRHSFTYRSYQWLVDLDDLPRLPRWLQPLARFDAADHLEGGRRGGGIRGDLARFLAVHGVALQATDRVVMLANARVLGHVFDPLTVFWVIAPDGALRAVVFEVHNTYGQRHCYLLYVDEQGRAQTEKAFYVSPFNDVSGRYRSRVQLSRELVAVTVGLDRGGDRVLTAVSRGTPRPATKGALLRVAFGHFFMPQRVTALIRLNGVRLWLRRLPVQPRPTMPRETAT